MDLIICKTDKAISDETRRVSPVDNIPSTEKLHHFGGKNSVTMFSLLLIDLEHSYDQILGFKI